MADILIAIGGAILAAAVVRAIFKAGWQAGADHACREIARTQREHGAAR